MFEREYVLLGLGDDDADGAIDWAAGEAHALNADLRIVHALHRGTSHTPWDANGDNPIPTRYREGADQRLRHAMERAHERHPDLVLHCEVLDAQPSRALVDRSRNALLTVLGSTRLGASGAAVLGSVSAEVAVEASGPVVLVGGTHRRLADDPGVVVGIDGTAETDDVLSFAFDYANRAGRAVYAVFCSPPDRLAGASARPAPRPPERAEHWLADVLSRWVEKYPDVVAHSAIVRAHPVAGLITAAIGQELLVVGSGSRAATTLGSVCQGVVHHARCSVAIVH